MPKWLPQYIVDAERTPPHPFDFRPIESKRGWMRDTEQKLAMLAPKMGRSTMVHSFHCREESMQNKYGLFVYFACGFCFRVKLQLLSTTLVQLSVCLIYLAWCQIHKNMRESKQKDIATLCKKVKKLCRNWCRNHENMTKMAPQIDPKSMKIQGSVTDAFWGGPGTPKVPTVFSFWGRFGDHFRPKIEKMVSKKASKNRSRKSIENVCQKAPKMMPKWTPKALIFHTLSKKAKTL